LTQTSERYDPEGQVVRNQNTTEDVSNSTEARAGGVAGISANVPDRNSGQPDQARPVNTTETTRKNHTTSYEINRTLTNITRNPGAIKGVTASVFVGQRLAPLPAGAAVDAKPTVQARTPEEMQALRQIVMNALGLRLAPGQAPETLVSLQEVPFQTEPVSQQIAAIQTETRVQSWIETGSRYFAVIVALGVFYVFWRILKKQQLEPVPVELLSDMPTRIQRGAYQLNGGSLTPELLNELIRQKPANIGNALRDWVNVKKDG
jgi:flagellar M-ring protein FliF